MKRILHIVGGMNRGGAETMLMNLYRALDRENFQFDFLYFTEKDCSYDSEIIALGGNIYRITSKGLYGRLAAFRKLLKDTKPDIVHSHILFSSAVYLTSAYFSGIKKRVAHSHNTSDKKGGGTLRRIYHGISRFLINSFANRYIACGEKAAAYLFYRNKNVLILPNAIDIEGYRKISSRNRDYLHREFSLPASCCKIIQIGILSEVKNQKFTLEFSRYLKSGGFDFHVLFVGTGELAGHLEQYAKENGLAENVTFLGVRTDIPYLLAGADLLIMPSLHEGFPVVLVESQAAGIPALISDDISGEVDLGVGLVTFESLSSGFDKWFATLQSIKDNKKIRTTGIIPGC